VNYPQIVTSGDGMSSDWTVLRAYSVGEIVNLNGKCVRITKKTSSALALEPYTWRERAEDWLLEKLGRFLP
jgi:hypothetical protein